MWPLAVCFYTKTDCDILERVYNTSILYYIMCYCSHSGAKVIYHRDVSVGMYIAAVKCMCI